MFIKLPSSVELLGSISHEVFTAALLLFVSIYSLLLNKLEILRGLIRATGARE
jgi:hypothetical protein